MANAVRTNIFWSPTAIKAYVSCTMPKTCNPVGQFFQTETGWFDARPAGLNSACKWWDISDAAVVGRWGGPGCPADGRSAGGAARSSNGKTPWIMVNANMAQKCQGAVAGVTE